MIQHSAVLPPTFADLKSDEVFRLLVNSVGDYAIFVLSPEGLISSWNRGA